MKMKQIQILNFRVNIEEENDELKNRQTVRLVEAMIDQDYSQ